ncbi:leukocyte tyrosine kinase receptor isoform X2 [Macrosteles quadrilineatus]|uniref:leukocyte tyrosine kinase receptor isoform X2 n=1 Tax=Macrosteles quadrilineatus TaxID=74068 RepID=UPI0023E2A634|nr:leukocyte tyrosine kinase receptor isoform X2 [Macrosteles quadrilineatus]
MRVFLCISVVLVTASAVPGPGLRCAFEDLCAWRWNSSDWEVASHGGGRPLANYSAQPVRDASNKTEGHYLLTVQWLPREVRVWSPKYAGTKDLCRLELAVHMSNMDVGWFKVVVETVSVNNTSWVVAEKPGNSNRTWDYWSFNVGRIKQEFNIVIEVIPGDHFPFHVALDNIRLVDCFSERRDECLPSQFLCGNTTMCIDHHQVCDMSLDCPDGSDERQNCDKVNIEGSRCNFEQNMCGWHNEEENWMNWTLNSGPTETDHTGPSTDHTYKNATGKYIYVEMSGSARLGAASLLVSPMFNPPPPVVFNVAGRHYNACSVSFYYHQYGAHSGSLTLMLKEQYNTQIKELWRSFGNQGNVWKRVIRPLPVVSQRYTLFFEAKKSYSMRGDVALDDYAMSPQCFGIGDFTKEELNGYHYPSAGSSYDPMGNGVVHPSFKNKTYYIFTTCGANGTNGPNQSLCDKEYNNTNVNVTVMPEEEKLQAGIQKWTVPKDGFYTIIAMGASGGLGAGGQGASKGAEARLVMELFVNKDLYILVGQQGTSSTKKDVPLSLAEFPRLGRLGSTRKFYGDQFTFTRESSMNSSKPNNKHSSRLKETLKKIKTITVLGGGGGGGGASYVYYMTKNKDKMPLLVGAGGGGLSHGPSTDDGTQHGHEPDQHGRNQTGDAFGEAPAGAGGGWLPGNYTYRDATGLALTQGGSGGTGCVAVFLGHGGFGGGGGGCTAGGGGGGYAGGRAWSDKGRNGEGGYSYIGTNGTLGHVVKGSSLGDGKVFIIPAVVGCDCEYRCVALDAHRSATMCICPTGWVLHKNGTSCIMINPPDERVLPNSALFFAAVSVFMMLAFTGVSILLYNRYQQKHASRFRRKILNGPDLQLNRLRVASNSMMTEYNPNYEFGGGTYTIRDLRDIPRDQLRLVKALGQGAFGEVYQGFFQHRAGDAVEMPVAVKTLPELSTNQAETDFLMEALIMSKFNNPNIVHFIGVCFDKHPRFIVIELLAGGDLKTFLRESRPKPERPSPLTMKDLLQCSIDVAKGCKYMEDHHFIHRDIAARNCLLTTKGPGRVVKIADFGMARDIYRADYYRKGGKAMLPIKWMPPEAFLDGIFTSKTDVWSFGVLLWEVMSLGYMPYTGCANREVMQLVTNGGRLESPSQCPEPIYAIMCQCWHPNPDERPNFGTLLERLGYCMQDPDVVNAPLPVFHRPPSTERDTTVMRPPANDDCLQPDYLVPLTGVVEGGIPTSQSTQPLLDSSNNNKPVPYANVAPDNPSANGPFIVSNHALPC